jgi:hypothetical protein
MLIRRQMPGHFSSAPRHIASACTARVSDPIVAKVAIMGRADGPNRFLEIVRENSNLVPRLGIVAIDINEAL